MNDDAELDKKAKVFVSYATLFDLDDSIAQTTIKLRCKFKIKTPDTIIAATALVNYLLKSNLIHKDYQKIVNFRNEYNDFVCFQITSKIDQSNLYAIDSSTIIDGDLKLRSFVKYNKCFTLNTELVDKKLVSVNNDLMKTLKKLFCNEI